MESIGEMAFSSQTLQLENCLIKVCLKVNENDLLLTLFFYFVNKVIKFNYHPIFTQGILYTCY